MTCTDQHASQLCRGLAHELSNILTFVLPAIEESGDLHRGLLPLLSGGTFAGLLPDFTPTDLERIGQQLRLGGGRLSQLFRDLRLASCTLQKDRLVPVAIADLLQAAAPGPTIAPAIAPVIDVRALGEVRVSGDPALLTEALSRVVRAATGWAQTASPPPAVRLLAHRASGRVRIRALLAGDPARLPGPESLLAMLCPNESGAVRAERGPLGILVGVHLFRIHGGDLTALREEGGVSLCGELPIKD